MSFLIKINVDDDNKRIIYMIDFSFQMKTLLLKHTKTV